MTGAGTSPTLDLAQFNAHLHSSRLGKAPGWANEVWSRLESTNDRAAELAADGAPEGVVVLSRQQTAGRGRLGRTWISPPDAGLYASFLLRPRGPRSDLPLFTLACGVAASQAIWQCAGLRTGLKWVNDLVVDGRKVGGILAEMPANRAPGALPGQSEPSDLPAALVLGIGINLRMRESDIPADLRDRVEWLERLARQPVDPNVLAAALADRLEAHYDILMSGNTASIIEEWKSRSVTLGRQIKVIAGGREIEGTAVDISPSGGLVVRKADGETTTLHAGEITIRGADGSFA